MDTYGFCQLSVIPVRADASDRSEMVNQLLFGDVFEIVDAFGSWKLIRTSHDKYEGFIDEKQFLPLEENNFERLTQTGDQFSADVIATVKDENSKQLLYLSPGSSMRGFKEGKLEVNGKIFSCDSQLISAYQAADRQGLIAFTRQFLHAPYLWGGRSVFGIDCSGLTQVVYKVFGIHLLRDASYQAQRGETLNLISEARPADLAFFDDEEGNIIHVGIVSGESTIIHASGQVREDGFDHQGIYNRSLKKYTHRLRLIKRIIQ